MSKDKVIPEQSSHWYRPDGTPAYGATLREARNEGLYPSVTTVMSVIDKPAITTWKINNMLDVAYEVMSWHSDKTDEQAKDAVKNFRNRVKREWEKRTTAARELGTKYHTAIETVLNGEEYSDPEINPVTLEAVRRWLKDNRVVIMGVETPFASPLLYGGRVDLWGKWRGGRDFVCDWKTTDTRGKTESRLFYVEYPIQLAACAYGLDVRTADLVTVIVSTTEEGVIKEKVWIDDENARCNNGYWFERFLNRFEVWKDERGYHPRSDKDELE